VFAESGYAGARMDEIADRAGVNKATIYYHIGDKESLYTRVLHEHFASAGDRLDQILRQADSSEKKLSVYIQHIAEVMDQNPHKAVMMLREVAAGGKHFPDVVARDLAGIIGKLMVILSEGEKKGQFIPANPFCVHLMVIGAFLLYRVSAPVREKLAGATNYAAPSAAHVSGDFVDEVQRLLTRALKTDSDLISAAGGRKRPV